MPPVKGLSKPYDHRYTFKNVHKQRNAIGEMAYNSWTSSVVDFDDISKEMSQETPQR